MNIPNPFILIDWSLIDYIFNPITWKIEYNFDKAAPEIAVYAVYVGVAIMLLGSFISQMIEVLLLVLFVGFVHIQQFTSTRTQHNRNCKTGLNRMREFWFARIVLIGIVSLVFLSMYMMSLMMPPAEHDSIHEVAGSYVMMFGFGFMVIVPLYFLATDKMPPGYGQTAPELA